ncbi:MAG: DNA alkylation repair protein [Candidatus Gracilibacteria bacterium]|nr:DNA alkylation repair protein [Candidatus Gracilibacteria bacterium]
MVQEKIILKDLLFNKEKVSELSGYIKKVYPEFEEKIYIEETIFLFPELELKQRIHHMKDMLRKHLPDDYITAVLILIKSLPEELDPEKTDNDFGSFTLSAYGEYIAEFGCNEEYLDFSLSCFEECTKRFSMEFAIRPFLIKYPNETLKYVKKWSVSENYHVRRFASEGIRPNLPWGGKVDIGIKTTLNILNNLYSDQTQYVLRSVANNLNDISKIDSDIVIQTLLSWKESGNQNKKNMLFLITHALRTQIKSGNPKALQLLGYYMPDIKIQDYNIHSSEVKIGESLEFSFDLSSNISQKLLINYVIHFVTARGSISTKIFHISKKSLRKGEHMTIQKKHPLRSMTTKKLYPGKHFVEIFINGEIFGKKEFQLNL